MGFLFSEAARGLFSHEEYDALRECLAVRRVIYYLHDLKVPLLLLDAYGKSRQANLSPEDKKVYRQLIPRFLREHQNRIKA